MAGSQKVFLRIVGLIGDSGDPDEMPDRVNVSGRGRLIPTIAAGAGDVAQGPDSLHEIRLIEPVPFDIVDGMLTYDGKPYIWLPVPTGEWMWRATFDQVWVGEQLRDLRDFSFPLDEATPAQIADEGYPGVNLAQYGIGAWEPGTVNLTAQAISQITIYLGRASNAAGDAEQSRQAAQQLATQINLTHDHIHQDVNHADTHALAAGTAAQTSIDKALEASDSAGVATTKASEAAQSRADALTFRNTAQGAATTATTKAGEAVQSALEALTSRDEAEGFRDEAGVSALTLSQRIETGAKELGVTSDGKLYFLDQADVGVPLRVDTTVGTRVFLGDVMIYGDTGDRDMHDMLPEGWSATTFRLRRVGQLVTIAIVELKRDAGNGATSIPDFIPGAFRPTPRHMFPISGASFVQINTAGGLSFINQDGSNIHGVIAYHTHKNWPTELPGIPGPGPSV